MGYQPFIAPGTRGDLRPNAFGQVGGSVVNQAVTSQYQRYKPQELVQLFSRHSTRPSFRLMIKSMGFNRGVAAPTTGHFEAPWIKNLVTVGSIVTPSAGPGTSVVIALDAADMFNPNVTVGGAARQASYPIVGDIIVFKDGNRGRIMVKNTAVTPHRLTISPLLSTVDLATSIIATEQYFIGTASFAEGSGLPEGRTSRIIEYSNTFQIVKGTAATTGTNLTDQTYFNPIEGQPGSFYLKVKDDAMKRFEEMCDGALMWGQQDNNNNEFVAELGFDVPLSGTEGLETFVAQNGNTDTYTVGAYTVADFDTLNAYYETERIGVRDMLLLQGYDINVEIENVLMDMFDADLAATIAGGYFFGNGTFPTLSQADDFQIHTPKEFAVSIGFRCIRKGGYNYAFYSCHIFNEYMGAGAPGYDYPNWQMVIPVGFTKEKTTNTYAPTFGYEYKMLNGYSREEVIAEIVGVGVAGTGTPYKIASNGSDIGTCGMLAEIAFHGTCANHISRQIPV